MKMRTPDATRCAAASAKRTGARTLRHQYSASSAVPSAGPPATVDTKGSAAGYGPRPASSCASAPSIGSIAALWNA